MRVSHAVNTTEKRDGFFARRVAALCQEIEKWARANDLWHDCGFFDYLERVDPLRWDDTAYAVVLAAEGDFARVIFARDYWAADGERDLPEEFDQILQRHGFWYEQYDHTEMWIYPNGNSLEAEFREHLRWKWICNLIKPDFDLLNEELYDHFGKTPDRLQALDWRDFEKLVAALLESQGYEVELGPGSNDGGVDIRLLQRDPVGDILTLVQVKRYRTDRRIRLDAVQALHGAMTAEGAPRSMFVTTSEYAVSARKFANRHNVPMTFHTSDDVQQWCRDAHNGIVEDKRTLVSEKNIAKIIEKAQTDHRQVLHSQGGYSMTMNTFAVVLKATRTSALLLELPTRTTEHDGYGQRGREVPDLGPALPLSHLRGNEIRRARRTPGSAGTFWDGHRRYAPWGGKPVHFDYMD